MINKEVKKEILKRDNNQCRGNTKINERCNKEIQDIHHIIPFRLSKDNSKINQVGLCKRHHSIADNTYLKYGLTSMAKLWLKENRKDHL